MIYIAVKSTNESRAHYGTTTQIHSAIVFSAAVWAAVRVSGL